jgi:hypothetical protein
LVNADIWNQAAATILRNRVVLIPPPPIAAVERGARAGLDILVNPHALVEVKLASLEPIRGTALATRNGPQGDGIFTARIRILLPWRELAVIETAIDDGGII